MPDLFSGKGKCPTYVAVRDEPNVQDVRAECERLWGLYRRLAASPFIDQFSRSFDTRFWEMYLGTRLLEHYPALTSASAGPDFVVPGPPRVAVEATVAGRGKGPDAVPDIALRTSDDDSVPIAACAMRVTSAVGTKAKANEAELEAALGPYVVAVNLPYPEPWLCDVPPLSAVAMLGCGGVTINLTTGVNTASAQPCLIKQNGAPVSTELFLDEQYAHISALVLAHVSPFSSTYSRPAVELLHNPRCNNRLPKGWLPFGCEYWVEGQNVVRQNHDAR